MLINNSDRNINDISNDNVNNVDQSIPISNFNLRSFFSPISKNKYHNLLL